MERFIRWDSMKMKFCLISWQIIYQWKEKHIMVLLKVYNNEYVIIWTYDFAIKMYTVGMLKIFITCVLEKCLNNITLNKQCINT